MSPVRQIVDDTKGKDSLWQRETTGFKPGIAAEKPEEVIEKIHQQATCLGPVMEEMLRAAHERGQSNWGLNE